ncbi:T20D4.11-like domain-containing protein [Caenorhabditis elegans]|uniref:T20D4.11-like domain-containing protein n=1 Tax=Caenorhabditis elegans TaxID=6239 RepID=H2L022_CAEEL|nr:DUF19 domain-containing protein [Caenorhabditis elegans]CCE67219.1 DUF19 domain-containing protein [Caenorhabditis elegans]|eukprot:NP_001256045.1 Uncharacterized protein CELE_K03B4.8 [Caenorhabditis elegans]
MILFQKTVVFSLFAFATSLILESEDVRDCVKWICSDALKTPDGCIKRIKYVPVDGPVEIGKTCFSESIKSVCRILKTKDTEKNYNTFLDDITKITANESDCYDPFNVFKQCRLVQFGRNALQMLVDYNYPNKNVDAKHVAKISKQCQIVKNLTDHCTPFDSSVDFIVEGCDVINLKQTSFMDCLSKLRKTNPNLSKYTCENFDIQTKNITTLKRIFTADKWCMEWIMRKHCGESSVVDFQKNAATFVININTTLSFFSGYNSI